EDLDFPFGEEYQETLPYAGNKVARYYLAETAEHAVELPVSPELGRPEHHEYRWVTYDEAEELLPPRLSIVLDWARRTISGGGRKAGSEPDFLATVGVSARFPSGPLLHRGSHGNRALTPIFGPILIRCSASPRRRR